MKKKLQDMLDKESNSLKAEIINIILQSKNPEKTLRDLYDKKCHS